MRAMAIKSRRKRSNTLYDNGKFKPNEGGRVDNIMDYKEDSNSSLQS